ncbi:MAG: HAMP domain-containing histidine kinase, partial [Myxococcales bacterium]|nr:HAMP domain-containing histidine kinase [Myxococcales bacterium]
PLGDPRIVLPWLVGLRWVAAAGQAVGLLALDRLAPTPQVARVLWAVLVVTAGSNVALALAARRARRVSEAAIAGVLILDVAILTAALAATGGPENPFAILYVVHIAMAVATGGGAASWAVVACAVLGYAALFAWHAETHLWHREIALPFAFPGPAASAIRIHLAGMWAATAAAAVSITYFMRQILRAAASHRASLRDAERRLERTRHLASLATLAAGAAHELSSPLGAVAVLARELERDADASDIASVRADALEIREAVEHCRAILDRMRADAAEELRPVGGGATVDALEALVDRELGAAGERVVWRAAPETTVDASLPHLAQLVLPLVRNALQASDGERVDVHLAASTAGLRVEVTDRGVGMTPEELERAVEPFYTTKPPGAGMGLGLHLVRIVAEALGGRLALRSEPGRGTTAVLELPPAGAAGALGPEARAR